MYKEKKKHNELIDDERRLYIKRIIKKSDAERVPKKKRRVPFSWKMQMKVN